MKTVLAVLLSLICTVCAAGQWSAIQDRFHCPGIDNSLVCAQAIERGLALDNVRRTSAGGLVVTLDSGQQKTLAAADTRFVVVEVLPRKRLLVIFEQYPEGGHFGWLNLSTGAYRRLPGYPLFSQKGDLVVLAEQDVEAGFSPNWLAVYRYAHGVLVPTHMVDTPNWGPGAVRWVGPNTLRYRVVTFACAVDADVACVERELRLRGPMK